MVVTYVYAAVNDLQPLIVQSTVKSGVLSFGCSGIPG